jgi:hypothetical protein
MPACIVMNDSDASANASYKVTVLLLILKFTANLVAITPHDDE